MTDTAIPATPQAAPAAGPDTAAFAPSTDIAASIIAGGSEPGDPSLPIFATSVLVTSDNVPAEGETETTPRLFYQVDG